jgi:Helicase conserved C-terminal domain
VACKHHSEIDRIAELTDCLFPEGVGIIDGRVPPAARAALLTAFRSSAQPMLMLIQPRSGGVSTNDLVAADCLINYSLEPSNIVWQQLIGRVYRSGQTTHVQIVTLLAAGTVDGPLYEGLRRNMDRTDLAQYLAAYLQGEPSHRDVPTGQGEPSHLGVPKGGGEPSHLGVPRRGGEPSHLGAPCREGEPSGMEASWTTGEPTGMEVT